MSTLTPRLSFRIILFAIAVIGTVPTLAFSGLLLLRYAQSERQRAERVLVENARGIARAIDAQFNEAEAMILALRTSPALETDDLSEFESRLRRTAAESGRHFALIAPNGQQLINTFLPPGQPLPRNELGFWAPAVNERRTYVTNVFAGTTTGQLLAGVGVPVMRGETVKWILASGLFAKDFAQVLEEPGVPEDWIVSIVDRTGRHLVRSHRNEQYAGKLLVPALVDLVTKGETGILRTTSLEGIPLISTVQYAPNSKWVAAVGLPVAALEAPMWMSLRDLLILGALVAAVALGLAFLVARLVDRSMLVLTAAAARVGRGEVVEPPASMVAETNDVGRVLAQTSRNLNELTTRLETQVAERTAELSKANANLVDEMKRRRDSEARVLQMQKIEAVGQLTGGIAHDFNNMLAIVLGSLQLLRRRLARGDTNVDKYVEGAVQGAERAASLTARLLAFSRQQALAPQIVDLNKLVAGMAEILRRTIPENVQIETVLAGGLWRTYADGQALESAIINLAANARDAMPDGGKLTIETANAYLDDSYVAAHADVKAGQYVMIAVTDTGAGMAPDVVGRAFDPFFTTKPTGQGTGLGLSQVHGFIRQSGGHVAIYSEPGHGTTVKLYLPRHFAGAQAGDEKRRETERLPHAQKGETILVVEDDAAVRRLAVEMLEELGYTTLEADSADGALAQLDAHPDVALLFTDVVMPGMNGRQLANEALQRRPDLAVLFTTGYTRNAIVHHGILDPDVHVIMKPHSLETLATKLRELLGNRSAK
jgi:signal transduction histidine kinase/ActR/RegA family two-component response regulator